MEVITRIKIVALFVTAAMFLSAGIIKKTKIYLLPGQGSDERIFEKIEFPNHYELVYLEYKMPDKGENLSEYAKRLSYQIEEDSGFILIGVSLGGMIASEIAEYKNPEQVIIISSAKNTNELPKRYTFQKSIPIHKLVGSKLSKLGAKMLQPIVEPDRKKEKEAFKAMLSDKDPVFLKRTIDMIINWDKETNTKDIIHIHGSKDHTIPIRNVSYDYLVNEGSHMMTLTRADEISKILSEILEE